MTSKDVLNLIRLYVAIEGKDKLGFSPEDVGTHSIRSSFAMFLHLQKVDRDRIMLQGRWRSSAFLDYIRPQVEAFSAGLSSIMTSCTNFSRCQKILKAHIYSNQDMHTSSVMTRPQSHRLHMARDLIRLCTLHHVQK